MKVLVSGATGLLGLELVNLLLAKGWEVRCLVRDGSPRRSRLESYPVEVAYGDAADTKSFSQALRGTEALVHAAGLEYTETVITAMQTESVDRLVAIGSTSTHSSFPSRSGPRIAMESLIRKSKLAWTIVRPSMIYGSELDKNMHRLLSFLDRWPVFPLFGSGRNLWQPVYYEDLAWGIAAALQYHSGIGQSYDLPGAQPLAYADLVQTAANALGTKTKIIRVPAAPVRRALQVGEALHLRLPVSSDQILRLREDKAYPYEKAQRELGYAPRSFSDGISSEVTRLREIGLVSNRA